ncbi:ATP-binding protein [Amycolatopsis sp. NPDC021455]|uniref:ATP-binding protein n=1 Tax=Amycolatopsis sp. NPDC021455 TaxID=3154901 RepID=UPI0033E82457
MTAAIPTLPDTLGADPVVMAENIRDGAERLAKRLPERYRRAMPTAPAVTAWVADVLANVRQPHMPVIRTGPSLLLLGPTGTGKTFQAYGAIAALALSGAACGWSFTTAADAYARLRPRPSVDPEAEFEKLAKIPVLVVDDLGAAKATEWTEEINYRLINFRYEHQLTTLITSNVPVANLKMSLGDRVTSRLSEMATRAVLAGPDRRRLFSRGEQES